MEWCLKIHILHLWAAWKRRDCRHSGWGFFVLFAVGPAFSDQGPHCFVTALLVKSSDLVLVSLDF